jgi:hypothetical protein
VCKCVLLPPGDNPIAVNKYIISYINYYCYDISLGATLSSSTPVSWKDTAWNNYNMVKHKNFYTVYYASWYSVFIHSLTSYNTVLLSEINPPIIESEFWLHFCKRTPLAYILSHMNKIKFHLFLRRILILFSHPQIVLHIGLFLSKATRSLKSFTNFL